MKRLLSRNDKGWASSLGIVLFVALGTAALPILIDLRTSSNSLSAILLSVPNNFGRMSSLDYLCQISFKSGQ